MNIIRPFFVFLCLFAFCAFGPFLENGEKGKVVRVLDGDSFILDSGLIVRMAQIEAPFIRSNDPQGYAARAALSNLILNKDINLKYGGLHRDRAGRALAFVFLPQGLMQEPINVNIEMLRQGFARVHTYQDNRVLVPDLWVAEREARRNARGIWQDPKYQVRYATIDALRGSENSFQLIEGRVFDVVQNGNILRLEFSDAREMGVSALIPQSAWQAWQGGVPDIMALKGHDIRVRGRISGAQSARTTKKGRVFNAHGPQIWLDHPEQVEYIIRR